MSVESEIMPKKLVPAESPFKIRSTSIKKFDKEFLLATYRTMCLSRRLDEKMLTLLKQGKGFFHIGASGHEAIQLAMAAAMTQEKDWGLPYYRDMSFCLGMGMTSREMLSAHLSRLTDTSAGRQMPSHFNSRQKRIVSVSSAIGAHFLPGLGIAHGIQKRGEDEVVYISSGDGGTSEGSFFELLNTASRTKAPVIIVVQDNGYAISVPVKDQTSNSSISRTASGFENLEIAEVDGTDFFNATAAAQKAVERARSGKGPTLIHAHTVRLLPHSSSDDHKKYRPAEELEQDALNDPILKLGQRLTSAKLATEKDLEAIKKEVHATVDSDTRWVMEQAEPKPETALDFVYSHRKDDFKYEKSLKDGDPIVIVDAINHAIAEEMERDDSVIVFGEDVAGGKGGVFTATRGLTDRFGSQRCFNSPLAEATITGMACGLAIKGFKPVIEIQFGDYIWPAMQQLRNQIPTLRFRSHNQYSCPMVIRIPIGGFIHGGLCHSQNIESIFGHIPGFKIVMPSNAADAKGLLKTAIRSDDPILYLEHKSLYRQGPARRDEPDFDYLVEIGKGKIVHEGNDLTIITYGAMVYKALKIARELAKQGKSIEVIDLRSIVPLDSELIFDSVKKTNRALVLYEDVEFAGFGAEISAQIAQFTFEHLDAPVRRVAGKFSPIPFAAPLEDYVLPQDEDVRHAVEDLLRY